jgi:hypothetical protein
MKVMKQIILTGAIALSSVSMSIAQQVKTPQPSPSAKMEQTVGLSTVSLDYSRPGVKDRVIFGDLVAYDQMWRTGANKNSMITFSDKISFGGTEVEPGTYAIFTKPGKTQWEVYLYTDTENWGTPEDWSDEKVAAKVMATPTMLKDKVENMLITVDNLSNTGGDFQLAWDHVMVSVPLTLATDDMVMSTITSVMAGPSANDMYSAARYYLENGKDMKQALEWMTKAVEMRGELFWNTRQLSLLQAANGDYKSAIKTAEKSMALSKEAKNDFYVQSNAKSIEEWGKMK